MGIKTRISLALALALIISLSTFLSSEEETLTNTADESAVNLPPMGIGTPDDPQARARWETERLADPATGMIPANIRQKELAFAKGLPRNESKSLNWERRGPFNKGGRTRAMALDVQDENIILAGGVSGGMWRSTDGGTNWVSTTTPDQMNSVTSIAQDTRPGQENVWYYGTGETYGIVSGTSFTSRYSGDGIFKSTDSGQSWTKLASTSSNTPNTHVSIGDFDFVWDVVVDHTNTTEDVVLAAVYDGIYRSTDGGSTWTAVLGIGTGSASLYTSLEITSTGVFYASGSSGNMKGLWRSEDGINWTDITPVGYPNGMARTEQAIDPQNENIVYWITHAPGTGQTEHVLWKYTYLSGNGSGAGGVWEDRSSNMPNTNCTGYFTFNFGPFNSQSGYDLEIAVHPTDSNTVFIGGTNIYRSTDAFSSSNNTEWVGGYQCDTIDPSNYVYTNHHPDQHVMFFSPSNSSVMYSANDGGVYRTNDCMATPIVWEDMNRGYFTTQFYTVAIEPGNVSTDYVIGGMQDNGTWFTSQSDEDSLWSEVGIDDGAYCAITANRDRYVISSQQGRVYLKDVDDSGNILNTQRIDPVGGGGYSFINPLILDAGNSNILYLSAGARIWRNDDLSGITLTGDIYNEISTNWTLMTGTQLGLPDGSITCLETEASAPNTLYIGTSTGKIYRVDDAQSANHSKTYINGANFPTAYLSCVAVNPHDSSELMATFAPYNIPSIFHTSDGGISWTDVGGNLEENLDGSGSGPAVYWSEVYPTFPSPTYFVGTSIGLFSTTELDGANTVWTMEGPNTLGNVVINQMVTRTFDGKFVVGTHGNGVYSANLSPAFVGLEEEAGLAADWNVYPNPFGNETTIEVELDQSQPVVVEVLSANGQLVRNLHQSQTSAGTHLWRWNGKNDTGQTLAAGTYFIRLQIGDQVTSKRVIFQP